MTKALRLETLLVLAGCYLAGCAASPTTAIGADDDRKSSSKSSSKSSDKGDDEDDEKADDEGEPADDEADNESGDDEASAESDETERPTPTRDAGNATAPAPTTPAPTTPRTDAGSLFPARVMCTGLADCTQQCAGAGMPCCRTSGTCGCTLGSFCL